MNPGNEVTDNGALKRLRKLERVLAWMMSALAVAMTICYFTAVGTHWPPFDQPVLGTPFSLGTVLGLGCLVTFIVMIVVFTVVSNRIELSQRS